MFFSTHWRRRQQRCLAACAEPMHRERAGRAQAAGRASLEQKNRRAGIGTR